MYGLFLTLLLSCTTHCHGNDGLLQNKKPVIPMPLLNSLNAPLVAQLDVTAINIELKAYIQQEIVNGVKLAMEELAATIVNTKVDQATIKLEESMQEKLTQANTEIQDKIGTTYIQWGRTNCTADDTETVYSGFVGGSAYTRSGSAVNILCLINDPQWGIYDSKVNDLPFIRGALFDVYDINVPNSPFDFEKYENHRVPCSVCMKKKKASTIMIPARKDCHGNWVKEYDGYLYAGHPSHSAATEYICLDKTPEALDKSPNYTDKMLCPPYVNGREVTCVVCSR
ncbi:uncharacterized protein LOC127712862 [Mytilus californianus]|uniref:uncharacterized protein LOC127712862 n=1 Tax=Mytilus californianus TaxID=6549 RepID=UPI002245FDA7|nr:uncharacterized protein LOC127712862 [Mytilus californianus]